ncbi:L-type lectin-domain containing receptor kinase IX.1-like [Magnolia sinica]|uniref:L-type lectin-domain containing receptor kinase IX.1-like n=1 Tax=Magnolia sinica TaxID=86752 RepID=UPI002658FB75|nr:L-type lectin-domain containing receptor kinase IX.1-like [Magnolia sinica]
MSFYQRISKQSLNTFIFSLFLFSILLPTTNSIEFKISRFDSGAPDILYEGDAASFNEAIELNRADYTCRVGRATFARPVRLWDSTTRNLSDFTTHFSFTIDTLNSSKYGSGFAFFLAPVGFGIPPNSAGGFLGLFNTTTFYSTSQNRIITVEFDSTPNGEWDPPTEHVGININSIESITYMNWNATSHSGTVANAWISYNASTKKLNVFLSYEKNPMFRANSNLSYDVDLRKVLPEWVTIGFSAATGVYQERHIIHSWEFSSTLSTKDRKRDGKALWVGMLVLSLGALISGVATGWMILRRKRIRTKEGDEEMVNFTSINGDLERGVGPKRFTYQELVSATKNFSNDGKLGQGGFGAVYQGFLSDQGLPVAVKKISRGSKQGKREYITEVKIISRLRHRNLVQLIGWCHDRGEFLLVYEFMPNRSLDYHLFTEKSSLTWAMRYKIALGLGSALLYLHEEWEQCVVHRDIKSSNVMLDSSFNAKLGDFGLARLMDHELGQQTTVPAGTLGYLAPECISTGKASKESDVFSFGVVALEIACGRKALELKDGESMVRLVEWVWELYGDQRLVDAADERLSMHYDTKQMECLMIVGLWCAHPDPGLRPSIKQVMKVLDFEAELPNLPNKLPVAMYHAPSLPLPPPASSSQSSISCSVLSTGR